MHKHETKNCPRCGAGFECRQGDITSCQCYGIPLTAEQEGYIAVHYDGCLCRNCLQQIQQHFLIIKQEAPQYAKRG